MCVLGTSSSVLVPASAKPVPKTVTSLEDLDVFFTMSHDPIHEEKGNKMTSIEEHENVNSNATIDLSKVCVFPTNPCMYAFRPIG